MASFNAVDEGSLSHSDAKGCDAKDCDVKFNTEDERSTSEYRPFESNDDANTNCMKINPTDIDDTTNDNYSNENTDYICECDDIKLNSVNYLNEESRPECDKQNSCLNSLGDVDRLIQLDSHVPHSDSSTCQSKHIEIPCVSTSHGDLTTSRSKHIEIPCVSTSHGDITTSRSKHIEIPCVSTSCGDNTQRIINNDTNLKASSKIPVPNSKVRKNKSYFSRNRSFDSLHNLNANMSNNQTVPTINSFADFFRSRKYHRTAPMSFNLQSGKRPNNFTLDKAALPFTKSSKLYKPVSSSFKSKQALLLNKSKFDSMLNVDDILVRTGQSTDIDCKQCKDYNNCFLPLPILVLVFSYLPLYDLLCRASRVCRYWYSAVFDPALWRYVNLSEQSNITDDILLKLTGKSDNVLGINLSTKGAAQLQISPETITTCLNRCPNLKTFNMARCFEFPAESFLCIGRYCGKLVHLDLDICSNITNEAIIAVGRGCSNLKILYLAQCSLIQNTGIVEVAHGCPLLQQLRIEQCDKISDPGIIEISKYCPDINYLHMLSCSLTDSSISQLIKLTELRMLDISNVTQLSPKVLTKVVQYCVKLEVLNVSLNRAVNDECVKNIVMSCPKLRVLSCVACRLTDRALEYVSECGQCVEHLDVAWCVDVTNYGVRYISTNNPSLRYLGLMQCRKVTSETIDELIEDHPDIHYSNFVTESRKILKKACEVNHEFEMLNVLS